jgi:hypothetical protein
MGEFANFEVDERVAAQEPVVKNQIEEKMIRVEGEAFLTGLEEITLAEFQEEIFKLASDDDLTELPGFGMWADREDMDNPTEWVQNLRRGRYRDF